MAPTVWAAEADLGRRGNSATIEGSLATADESSLPLCIPMCISRGNAEGCDPNDLLCLCNSQTYQMSVLNCWSGLCSASELNTALVYAQDQCLQASAGSGGNTSSLGSNASLPVATNIIFPPVILTHTAHHIQIIMSSICSLFLVIAVVLGIFNCRNQMKREAEVAERWTHNSGDIKLRGIRSQTSTTELECEQTYTQFLRTIPGRHALGPLDSITEVDGDFRMTLPAPDDHLREPSSSREHSVRGSGMGTGRGFGIDSGGSVGPSFNRPNRGMGLDSRGSVSTAGFTNRISPEEREALRQGSMGVDIGTSEDEPRSDTGSEQDLVSSRPESSALGSATYPSMEKDGTQYKLGPGLDKGKGKAQATVESVHDSCSFTGSTHPSPSINAPSTFGGRHGDDGDDHVPPSPTMHPLSEFGSTTNLRKVMGTPPPTPQT